VGVREQKRLNTAALTDVEDRLLCELRTALRSCWAQQQNEQKCVVRFLVRTFHKLVLFSQFMSLIILDVNFISNTNGTNFGVKA
jgi:hypothetical protein